MRGGLSDTWPVCQIDDRVLVQLATFGPCPLLVLFFLLLLPLLLLVLLRLGALTGCGGACLDLRGVSLAPASPVSIKHINKAEASV
jgi:hypothetical protein